MSLLVDIHKRFKDFTLNVAFETKGDFLGILGASGSGKSMTLKCIAGVETPDQGRIQLNGRVLFDSQRRINIRPQDRRVGYLFQHYALFPNMTAEENLKVALRRTQRTISDRMNELIHLFHLEGLEKRYPSQLSGGQQQRVALARIFAQDPDVLLLDEPFSAFDYHLKEQIQSEVLKYLRGYKGEVLMVSHSRNEVYRFCKQLAVIHQGRTLSVGRTKSIFQNPKMLPIARLTGCENISPCSVVSTHCLHVRDWEMDLKTQEPLSLEYEYVGIHSRDIERAYDGAEENTFECQIVNIIEAPLEYTVLLKNKDDCGQNFGSLLYKIKKEEWEDIGLKDTIFIKIPKEAILLLK